ncbi:methionine synthase [Candidatus Margulisiibacteriota bacterium]
MKILATGIGSLPHKTSDEACEFILNNFVNIPFWPQLPKTSFLESMYAQYSEGMPCVVIDNENQKIYFQIEDDITSELEKFYERIIADDVDFFQITEQYAAGLHHFLNLQLTTNNLQLAAVKGHITGPISFGLTVVDQNKRAIFYHEHFKDVIVKALAMKARWQVRQLKKFSNEIIIFVDEPYLASFGSAFVSLQREEVINAVNEVVGAIHQEGAKSAIHCCGNTDWGLLMDTEVKIISFDAYEYFDSFALYPERLKEYLNRGGMLAWGIVPASDKINQETSEAIAARFHRGVKVLVDKGIDEDKLLAQSLITPSCGVGSLPQETAERVISLTCEVSNEISR